MTENTELGKGPTALPTMEPISLPNWLQVFEVPLQKGRNLKPLV